jgi:Cu(I)/Ag(I) efflux system membrane fusion protein
MRTVASFAVSCAASCAAALSLVVVAAACSAEAAPPAGHGGPDGGAHGTPPAPTAPTAPAAALPAGPRGVVLARYEALRAALADDKGAAIAAELPALRTAVAALAADKAAAGAADLQKGLDGLAAATTTKDGAAVDLKAARVAFGELSRGVVAAIAADPALQAGRFLFECPMAAGYQRWVQNSATMANPYMGKRMLECGSPVAAWRVEG